MSGLSSWLWGTSQIDDAVDRATSEMLPAGTEDIALNLEICDQIRSKAVPANLAMKALKRRLSHKNPNVQLSALGLTDICIKNGGDHFLTEVASREFMDNLVSILKMPVLNLDVKNTILRLIQNWSAAFEGKLSLYYVGQVYKSLVNEGFNFPPKDFTAANAAMVDTSTAPEWIDSDVCLRCRTAFTFTNRKHHCRNCGQVFDQQCSSKSLPLPHFGITQEVRVCDGCYNKLSKKAERSDKGHRHSQSVHGTSSTRYRSPRDLADEELQRAIQLSLEESRAANGYRPGYVSSQPDPSQWQPSEPPIVDHRTHPSRRAKSLPPEDEEDEDLKAAIEASLREANAPKASAPAALPTPQNEYPSYQATPKPRIPNYDLQPVESDAIMRFSQQVEQFQAAGARDMARYPGLSELYEAANNLRNKMTTSLDDTGRKEQLLTEMHEKMAQIVKMYDGLLSEQITHSRTQPQQYQPANSAYSMGYHPQQAVNGYAQWNQPQTHQPLQPVPEQAQAVPSYQQLQQNYWNQAPQGIQQQVTGPAHSYQQPAASGYQQYQSSQAPELSQQASGYLQYQPPQHLQQYQQSGSTTSAYQPSSQADSSQSSFQQQSQPAYPQYQYEQAQPGPSTAPAAPATPLQNYSTPATYQPPSHPTYSNPSSFQSPPQAATSPPLVTLPPSTLSPVSILPATTASPSPPVAHSSPPAASPTLSRQNTMSTYTAPHPQHTTSHLARSNTIAQTPYHHPTAPLQQHQQPQHQQPVMPAFPAVSTLPVFPSVPTATPQPTQIQPEREALLIDL